MTTHLRGDAATITIGSEYTANDVRAFGFIDDRRPEVVTRDTDEAIRYSAHLPGGSIQLAVKVDGDGSRVPVTSGTVIRVTLKQASGHTAHSFDVLATRVSKSGDFSSDDQALVVIDCVRTNDYVA